MAGYKYRDPARGGTLTDGEVKARVAAAQAKAAGNGPPALRPPQSPAPDLRSVPEIKGAVKVGKFPSVSQYPFREIADDGGIWKLDPAAFTWRGKPIAAASLRAAAMNWASKEGYSVKTVLDGGQVYVQFTPKGGAA